MATQTERANALKSLAAFRKQLPSAGFEGDATDPIEVSKYINDNPDKFEKGTAEKHAKAVKALSAEISPDGMQALVSWSEGEASMYEEAPEEEAAPVKQLAQAVQEIRKVRNELDTLKANSKRGTTVTGVRPADAYKWDNFKSKGINTFHSPEEASAFGAALVASDPKFGKKFPELARRASKTLSDMGTKGNATSPITAGGALMAEGYDTRLIDRLAEYEYASSNRLEQVNMNEDVVKRGRATNQLTIHYVGEATAPTRTQLATDQITLVAQKAIGLADISNELLDGSFINIAETMSAKFVQAFAKQADDNLFIGDGTAAYGGVIGLGTIFGSTATADARSVTGGGTADAHTLAHLYTLTALLDDIYKEDAAWFCTSVIKAVVFQRLAGSVGGLGLMEIAGKQVDTFLGLPIIVNRSMNNSIDASGDAIDAYLGSMSMAGMHGLRKNVEIAVSDQHAFDTDEVVMRGVFRHDINLYDTGSTSEAGAIVALYQT
jgi:HK97 family phage major capsid protein